MKVRILLVVLVSLAVLCPGLAPVAVADEWEEVFFKANQAYKAGDYDKAVEGYSTLIQAGYGGGPIHYNLGNAFYKSGRLGKAILEYERALLLMPRDPDLRFNLSLARDQTRDAVQPTGGVFETAFFWVNSFNPNELFWAFAVLNLILWTVLTIRLFTATEWLYYALLVVISLWVVAGLSFGLKYYWIQTDDRAVILEKEVDILAGPDERDTVLFRLHEGTVVRGDRSEGGWILIHLPDGKRGWVRSEAVEMISPRDHALPSPP